MRWTRVAIAAAVMLGLLASCTRPPRPTPTGRGLVPAETGPAITPTRIIIQHEAPTAPPDPGLPNVGSLAGPTPPPQVYSVQAGDTLSAIARKFGIELDALIAANELADPNALRVGQELKVPSTYVTFGPSDRLLPDSEFVNGPAYVGFDVASVCGTFDGYLCSYSEKVSGQVLDGPQIVERVAHEYSVGPRMLLSVLETKSGWLTDPKPAGDALLYPMGYRRAGAGLLSQQLAWAANQLNQGYYDWRGRGAPPIAWGDGTATAYHPSLNAATAALQFFYAVGANKATWERFIGDGPGSFTTAYRLLFGNAAEYAVEPLVPANTKQPKLELPWPAGELWYYTSGPHGGWGEGSAWAAIDVVPAEGYLGCQMARSWATAAAAGVVAYSDEGQVVLDLDGDGHEQTGWVLLYLHVARQDRAELGAWLKAGDPIGHPSCEGGFSEATHLHFARKYNGEWIAADGPIPMILSGWQFHSAGTSYDGTATRGELVRTACECQNPEYNGLAVQP